MQTKRVLLPLLFTGVCAVSLATPFVAQAESAPQWGTAGTPIAEANEHASSSAKLQSRMNRMETNADKEIQRRITVLQGLITRINSMQRISAAQKKELTGEVQTVINDLTALKAKIDADTDPATLKADKQSIVTSYRVFVVLMPKIEIMAHADAELALATQMAANNATIQAKITALQTAGKNVTALQTLLTDRTAKIADAQTQAQNALNAVTPLTAAGYPGNKATLMSARDMLKTAATDLKAAYQDLVQINKTAKTL